MPRIIGRIAKHMFDSLTKCRLCRQVTGAVFLAILFVEGAILIFSVNNFERDRLIEIEREGLAVVRAWLEISSDDVEVLTRNAPRIGGGSVLLSATVYDKNHNELANLSQNSILAPDIDTFSVTWGEEKLGYPLVVHAKLDKTEIPAQIEKFVFGIVILVLLISFFVTVVTMLILERLLLIPIRRIRKRMNEACTDLSNPQDYLLENNKNDELGDVAKSYNDLLVRLSSAFSEIQIQQTNLERNNQKLEKEVNERTKELNSVVRDLRREAVERERAEKALDASNAHMSAEPLRKLAYPDTLTGLANRAFFIDRCDQLLSQLKRSDINAALHLIDID